MNNGKCSCEGWVILIDGVTGVSMSGRLLVSAVNGDDERLSVDTAV